MQGWDTNSFFNFEPDGVLPEASIVDDTFRCGHVQASRGPDGQLMFALPGGTASNGERIDPLTAPVVDISVFVEGDDGAVGIYFFDPNDPSISDAFAAVP